MTVLSTYLEPSPQSTLPGMPVVQGTAQSAGTKAPLEPPPHILCDPDFELPDLEINCAVYTIRGRFFIGSASFWYRSGSWSCISFMRPLSWMSGTFIEEMAQALKDRGLFAIWGRKKVNPYRDNHPVTAEPTLEPL